MLFIQQIEKNPGSWTIRDKPQHYYFTTFYANMQQESDISNKFVENKQEKNVRFVQNAPLPVGIGCAIL